MAYNRSQYNVEYAKRTLKRVPLDIRKDFFANVLKPAAEMCDMGMNTFIKMAILEKIRREGLDLPVDRYHI